MEELFPLVNEQGELIDKATRAYCHSGSFVLHPVVHLHVFNSAGQLFLQKRSMLKDIQPGMWDTSVGGHVDYEETLAVGGSVANSVADTVVDTVVDSVADTVVDSVADSVANSDAGLAAPAPWVLSAMRREAREELGIISFEPLFVFRYSFRSMYEYELVHIFLTIYDGPLSVDPAEISEGRFWDRSEILSNLGKGLFTPNFEGEINQVLDSHLKLLAANSRK